MRSGRGRTGAQWLGAGPSGQFLAGVVLLALMQACRSVPPDSRERRELPALHVEEVLAPPTEAISVTIQKLERAGRASTLSPASQWAIRLRLARLHAELGAHAQAERELAKVLQGPSPASPRAEAIAWFLRSRLDAARGRDADAKLALERADRLAVDPSLRRRIEEVRQVARAPTEAAPAKPAARPVAFVRRSVWSRLRARTDRMDPMGHPTRITIHHSGLYADGSADSAVRHIRSFQRTHVMQRGWGDIGYHFLLDGSGRIYEGRDLRYQGAHAGNGTANKHNIGVCLLGNFHPGSGERVQRPSEAQVASLERLCRFLCEHLGIDPKRIYTHKEVHPRGPAATQCPGAYLQPVVRDLRRRMWLEGIVGSR